jgi:hypothetical protein
MRIFMFTGIRASVVVADYLEVACMRPTTCFVNGTSACPGEFLGRLNHFGAELCPLPPLEMQMSESKHHRADKSDKPVRDNIEAQRERDKRREEDEVGTSSDDSFPASDPPSFTGVTGAADIEKKKKSKRG